MNIREIQAALSRAGFTTAIDGAWGRKSIDALKAFQKAKGLLVDGLIGPKTLAVLFPDAPRATSALAEPVWVVEARRKMGLHEVKNRSALMAWLRSDGSTLGDPSKLPWCGDFVETCIALTLPGEPMVTNPYYALNWTKFGRPLSRPSIGAVLVFWRDGGGHVGLYVGEDQFAYHVLGGNQDNGVSIVRIAKNRLAKDGIRWPSTVALPTTGPVVRTLAGSLSTNEA
jgi:uncharacterized protein (TIGR02594 family)